MRTRCRRPPARAETRASKKIHHSGDEMNRNGRALVLATVFLLAASGAAAQHTPEAKPRQALDDAMKAMFGVQSFHQAAISPNGKMVAWVESLAGPGGAPSANSAIYVANADGTGTPRRITAGTGTPRRHTAGDANTAHQEQDIAWSPDSTKLAFLSDAAQQGQLQLYIALVNSSTPAKKLTSFKGFVSGPGWSPDGTRIALLYTENATRAAGPLVAETPDEGVVSENFLEQRLTLVDPATATTRQVSPADMYVYEFDWAPDSKRLVVTAAPGNGDDNWYIANFFALDSTSNTMTPLMQKAAMQIAVPRWSPDGKTIAFIGGLMSDEGFIGGDVYSIPAMGGDPRDLTPGMKASARTITWSADSKKILCAEFKDGLATLGAIDASAGGENTLHTSEGHVSAGGYGIAISISADGQTSAAVQQSFDNPPEVWAGKLGAWKQITHKNASLHPTWGKSVSLHWTTEIGSVQGWLTYPLDFDPAKKYPLIVCVHGGPSSAVTPSWPSRGLITKLCPRRGIFCCNPI